MRWLALAFILVGLTAHAQTTFDTRVAASAKAMVVEQQLLKDLLAAQKTAQAALVTAQAALATAKADNVTAQTQIATLTAQVATLQGQVAALNVQLAVAQAQATADATTIASLKAQLAAVVPGACTAPFMCLLPPPVVAPPPPLPVNTATLTWDVMPTATGYRVYSGTASGTYQSLGTGTLVTANTFTFASLAPGFRYFFAVTAIYPTVESGFSNEVFKDIGVAPPPPVVESPSGTNLTVPGVGSIIDSVGAVWTLGPPDASGFFVKARNGVIDGAASVLCYSGRVVYARGDLAGGWWKWTNDATLPLKGSWTLISTTPTGCL